MSLILLALVLIVCGGIAALICGGRPRLATVLGAGGAVAGSVVGLVAAASAFVGSDGLPQSLTAPWNTPLGGSLTVSLDGLSAFFLLVIFGISALAALYGGEYLLAWRGRKNLGLAWFFFNVLVASMAVVCLAANGLLFLLAWEAMSLSSYFLVMFEDERPEVRRAGWTYLVATHLGTALLLVLFVLMAAGGGSFDFAGFRSFGAAGGPALSAA
jgi:formate hydrogenlyase subunit 3/multisubunit Na+/H+ antiporter MnhD subunit